MSLSKRLLALVPDDLLVEGYEIHPDRLFVHARARAIDGQCPMCGTRSQSVHSHYRRTLHDLPCHGRIVVIQVTMRRFRCRATACLRSIFAERLSDVAEAYGRRTCRMDLIAHHLGLALGGRPAARMGRRLSMPLSADSFLRLIRRRAKIPNDPLCVVGIDDWAWRRGQRYGTIVCDLERRRIIDLLPNREPVTVEAWLADHQGIEIIARDRSDQFHTMTRTLDADRLDAWIKTAKAGLLDSLANGITADRDAVHAALREPWSNGQTEGQITKLKLMKRQMYERAKLDLLRARVMAAWKYHQKLHQKCVRAKIGR